MSRVPFWTRYRTWILSFLATLAVLVIIGYVDSFAFLSRRGMQEAAPFRMKGFLHYASTISRTGSIER